MSTVPVHQSLIAKGRRILSSVPAVRSSYYLVLELRRGFREKYPFHHAQFEGTFRHRRDPWLYTGNDHSERFKVALDFIEIARGETTINHVIEVGCAEGTFTQMIAGSSFNLTAIDFSETALSRAQARCAGLSSSIVFHQRDLLAETEIPQPAGGFDLVIAMDVLESYLWRRDLILGKQKLLDLLRPHGFLLVTSTSRGEVVEETFWSHWLIRGRNVNRFLGSDKHLVVWKDVRTMTHQCTLYRKAKGE